MGRHDTVARLVSLPPLVHGEEEERVADLWDGCCLGVSTEADGGRGKQM